ncbi:MAG: 2-dehydro-3-deoxygalactonokinase [Pseudomonadota bacterium]|nr:2-dehydro-3-deoxygalactonokinase [Pseudomonadota bacterium]
MHRTEGFIAADWGTTNRRAYLIGHEGSQSAEFEDDRGVLSVGRGEFPQAVAEIRGRLGNLPLLLAGMVGSNRGWVEAPYVPCPAGIEDVAKRVVWAEEGRTAIVPGVSFADGDRADVMRGEEVQILGAVASGTVPADCLVCHPGTHNKWIVVEGGRIARFRTVMTGELFNLLREHSILSELLAQPAEADSAFRSGVRHSLENDDLTAELFTVRARVLLGKAEREDAASYVSGLLIGADVRVGCKDTSGQVVVMGRPELTMLYAAALKELGRASMEIDGEEAFLQGIGKLAELIK